MRSAAAEDGRSQERLQSSPFVNTSGCDLCIALGLGCSRDDKYAQELLFSSLEARPLL